MAPPPLDRLRIPVPKGYLTEGLDEWTGRAFENALASLARAAAKVEERRCEAIEDIRTATAAGSFAGPESFAWHQSLIEKKRASYDPRILARIESGSGMSAAAYIRLVEAQREPKKRFAGVMEAFDVVALPTSSIMPLVLAELEDDATFLRANAAILRNPSAFNIPGGCSLSLPVGTPPIRRSDRCCRASRATTNGCCAAVRPPRRNSKHPFRAATFRPRRRRTVLPAKSASARV